MYRMKADGVVFYDPSSDDMSLHVLSPKASLELNKAGSLQFTLLPGNVMYDSLQKLKTVITLEQDDEIIFRGRVLETTTDVYNRKEVYCEGELAFLLDSIVRPYEFKGKAADLFRQLVTKHNEQVEDYKRFEIGIITAVTDEDDMETEGDGYADTLSEINSLLLDGFGGYIRVRRANGTRYLDYVDAFDQTCTQEITFGVNIVDIESKVNAQDVCTVLVPLGKDSTTIAKANGGRDYIEDAALIAQYGRIVKTYTWDDVTDPAVLLTLAQEYMQKMKAETTLTITAVDLRSAGADVDGIRIGSAVKLTSLPHGLDKEDICTAADIDIENPEKSDYTFGLPRETLTASTANALKSMSGSINDQHRWLTETETALNITVEAINLIGHRTTQLEIDVDAAEAAITLKASQDSVDILEEKHNAVELRLDAAEGTIEAQAKEIYLKADKTYVDNLVTKYATVEELETVQSWATDFACVTVSASSVIAGYGDFDELVCGQLNGGTAATQEWVKNQGYLTHIPTGSLDGFVTATDVKNYCEPLYATKTELSGYVQSSSLTRTTQYVVTNVKKTMNSAGYVTDVTYSGTSISYYT